MPPKETSCFDRALAMLTRRDYAQKELVDKLREKGHMPAEISETLDKLMELNYLDDARFAAGRIRYRAEVSKWGKKRIALELRQKGVAESVLTQAFLDWEEEDKVQEFGETARQLVVKKFGEGAPGDDKEKQRRLNFLLRRGFSMDEALKALDS